MQRAKEYSAKIILLELNAKSDSTQDYIQKTNIAELQGQLVAKDTLISTANQKKDIVIKERDKAIRQKKGWKAGFIASWAAIVGILTYSEIKNHGG